MGGEGKNLGGLAAARVLEGSWCGGGGGGVWDKLAGYFDFLFFTFFFLSVSLEEEGVSGLCDYWV